MDRVHNPVFYSYWNNSKRIGERLLLPLSQMKEVLTVEFELELEKRFSAPS